MSEEIDSSVWYGEYGGCFVADAFSGSCDDYYEQYVKIVSEEQFKRDFSELRERVSTRSFKFSKSGDIWVVTASENYDPIIGTALLAKRLGMNNVVCGVRYADEAIMVAKVCSLLKLKVHMILGRAVSQDESLCEMLRLTNADVDTQTCLTLFDLPEMYAFQIWIGEPKQCSIINCRSNAGAFPQTNIAADFSRTYGEELKLQVPSSIKHIVIPCITGSYALGIIRAFQSTPISIETVECDTALNMTEELDSYCGTFTKVMRNRTSDRVLSPALSNMFDQKNVQRTIVGCSTVDIIDPSLSLQSNAALSVAVTEGNGTLCIVRNLRCGSTI